MARLVAEAWSAAASAYGTHWAPRFAPFVHDVLTSLAASAAAAEAGALPPPPGPVLALGCGPTGDELVGLAGTFPGRAVHALDLSPGVVDQARAAVRRRGDGAGATITVAVGDARAALSSHTPSILFSAFTLQALPARPAVVRRWVAGLPVGGLAALLWWPPPPAQPDAAWAAVTAGPPGKDGQDGGGGGGGGGGGDEHAAVLAAARAAGGRVVVDARPAHALRFPTRAALAAALVEGGPLTVAAAVDRGRAERVAAAAAGLAEADEAAGGGGGVVLRPMAWLVVLRKEAGARL